MYVCVCNSVTDRDIKHAANKGAHTLEELSEQLNIATCCKNCAECAVAVLKEALEKR